MALKSRYNRVTDYFRTTGANGGKGADKMSTKTVDKLCAHYETLEKAFGHGVARDSETQSKNNSVEEDNQDRNVDKDAVCRLCLSPNQLSSELFKDKQKPGSFWSIIKDCFQISVSFP